MVINFPNFTLYFFKRATPLRLTKQTFPQWSFYIIIYSEMFCILPKDGKDSLEYLKDLQLRLQLLGFSLQSRHLWAKLRRKSPVECIDCHSRLHCDVSAT